MSYLENNSRGSGRHRFEVHTISQALKAWGAIPAFRSTCEKRGGSQLKAHWS